MLLALEPQLNAVVMVHAQREFAAASMAGTDLTVTLLELFPLMFP